MSPPRRDKSTLPDPSYHWTTCKARVFLRALSEFGRVSEATAFVGMSRNSAYRLRERLGEDSLLASAWDQAYAAGRAERRVRKAWSCREPLPPERDIFGLGK